MIDFSLHQKEGSSNVRSPILSKICKVGIKSPPGVTPGVPEVPPDPGDPAAGAGGDP